MEREMAEFHKLKMLTLKTMENIELEPLLKALKDTEVISQEEKNYIMGKSMKTEKLETIVDVLKEKQTWVYYSLLDSLESTDQYGAVDKLERGIQHFIFIARRNEN